MTDQCVTCCGRIPKILKDGASVPAAQGDYLISLILITLKLKSKIIFQVLVRI